MLDVDHGTYPFVTSSNTVAANAATGAGVEPPAAARVGGINGLALTKLDVLDGFAQLRICTGYTLDGGEVRHFPAAPAAQGRIKPVFETMDGWSDSTRGARSWAELPAQAIKYVRRIEELVEAPVTLLSTSPDRDDTILMRDPFEG